MIIESSAINAKCPLCDYEIQNHNFRINETLKIMIDEFELHEFKLDPEYESILKKFREKIEFFKNMCNIPEIIINDKFSELRRSVDLDRETAKLDINNKVGDILDKLSSYENECRHECNSIESIDYYSRLIENMNGKLKDFERFFQSLRNTEYDRLNKSAEIREAIQILNLEIRDYERKLFKDRSLAYEPMKNVPAKLNVSICLNMFDCN
jgi:hypothetical protein